MKVIVKSLKITGLVFLAIAILIGSFWGYVYYTTSKEEARIEKAELSFDAGKWKWKWYNKFNHIQIYTSDESGKSFLRKVYLEKQYIIFAYKNEDLSLSAMVEFFTDCQPNTEIITSQKFSDGTPKKLICNKEGNALSYSVTWRNRKDTNIIWEENLDGFKLRENFGYWDFTKLDKEITLSKAKVKTDAVAEDVVQGGSIRVESEPKGAKIYLDGDNIGTTPDSIMRIVPGTHNVEIKMDGYSVWSKRVDVEIGEEASVLARLLKKISHASLRSSYRKEILSQVQLMPNISISEKGVTGFFGHSIINHNYEIKYINGDIVVLDHATGLMWHQYGSEAPLDMNYKRADKWLKDLNKGAYAGYNDWRLPTVEEAASLLAPNMTNNLYIDSVFSNEQGRIWTGDKHGSDGAWYVGFLSARSSGFVSWDNVSNSYGVSVRPVRSINKLYGVPQFYVPHLTK